MGNALQSVSKAVDSKFIGGNPLESKFAAIDKGILGVKTWKDNIDAERLKLKTDTASQIREAEKYAYENMPNSETAKTRILADLAKYKDQMLMNERLVRNGSIPPKENLIFLENGKQTFEIYADMVNNFDAELTKTEQRAKGFYKDNDDGTKTFVPPVAGELEAIKQQIQTQIGTLAGIETNFTEQGMGDVTFFQMEVDPVTNTYREKRDAKGNKIPLQNTQPNMSVLALSHKANTRSDRRYLTTEVDEFSKQTSLIYDTMYDEGMLVGNVATDARNNPELATLIENKTSALTTDIDAVASYFGKDNGFGGQLVSFTQWDNLSDEQKKETITATILDENLEEKSITYKKYAKVAAANSNNAIVPELDKDQIAATQGHVRKSLVAGLQRKIKKGDKRQEFAADRTAARIDKKERDQFKGDFEVASRIASGGNERVKTLNQLKNSSVYTNEKGYNQVKEFSEELALDTNGDGEKDSFGLEVTVLNRDGETEVLQLITRDENGSPLSEDEMENNVLNIMGRDPVKIENMREVVGSNYKKTKTQTIDLTEKAYNKLPDKLKSRIESQAGGKNNVVVKDGKVFKKVTKDGKETLEQIQVKDDRKVNVRPEVAVTYSGMSDLAFGADKDTNQLITADDLFADADKGDNTEGSDVKNAFDKVYTAAIKKYGLPKGELTFEVDNTGGTNYRINIRKNGVLVVRHEEDGENVSKAKNYLDKYIREATKSKDQSGGKRTIAQIMNEDDVSRAEAIKIFKNQ